MAEKFSFVVDGKPVALEAEPVMPLLYALRNELGMNNPKFGCGKAQCGACTVHVDGAPMRSCVTPVRLMRGKRVTTLAGLGTAENPIRCNKPKSTKACRNAAFVYLAG